LTQAIDKISVCLVWWSWLITFSYHFVEKISVVSFGLPALRKTTWSVQDVWVNKGNMWDHMFEHVCNIWHLSEGHDGCCSKRIFVVLF
jgi:hypothetical protein